MWSPPKPASDNTWDLSKLLSSHPQKMDLLTALDVLRNAPDESLHTHATQTISTLKEIGKRLQHFSLPCSHAVNINTQASVEFTPLHLPAESEVVYSPVVVDTPASVDTGLSSGGKILKPTPI